MKKAKITALFLSTMLFLTCFAGGMPIAAEDENLFVNTSFEEAATGEDGVTLVPGWFAWTDASERVTDIFTYSETEKVSGARSLAFKGTAIKSRGIEQDYALSAEDAGKAFSISFYAKNVNSTRAKVRAELYHYDETDTPVVTEKIERSVRANNAWTKYNFPVQMGEKPCKIKFVITQNGTDGASGTDETVMYIDDVALSEGDAEPIVIPVRNAGFEEAQTGTDATGVVPGWIAWAGEALTDIFKYSTTEKISGERSLEYRGTDIVSRGLQQDIPMDSADANKTFRVSFYAKNVNSARASFKMEKYEYNEAGTAELTETQTTSITADGTWKHYYKTVTLGERPQRIRLYFFQNGKASNETAAEADSIVMYLDDIAIKESKPEGDNQFENGGLEDVYIENGAPYPYGSFTGSTGFTVGESYAHTGKTGMHVDSSAAYVRNVIEANTVKGFGTFRAGDAVTISWNLRSNTETRYQVMCCAGPNEGNRIADTGSWIENPSNGMLYKAATGGVWKNHSYSFVIPENCTYIKFVFFTMQDGKTPQSGYADFDNFNLKKAESAITFTRTNETFGETPLTTLSSGDVNVQATYVGKAEDKPMLVSVLYKTENDLTSIEQMEMVALTGNSAVKTAALDALFTIPKKDIDLYEVKSFIWEGGTVKPIVKNELSYIEE